MPVDEEFSDPARLGIPRGMGVQGRAHVGVFELQRGDWELAAYRRSPWQTINSKWRSMMMRCTLAQLAASGVLSQVVTDDGGTDRTLTLFAPQASSGVLWNATDNWANDVAILKYGTDATAPSGTQTNLLAPVGANITGTSVLYSPPVKVSGRRVHAEASVTVREVGLFMAYNVDVSVPTRPYFMVDRAVIGAVSVGMNNSLRIEFQLVF